MASTGVRTLIDSPLGTVSLDAVEKAETLLLALQFEKNASAAQKLVVSVYGVCECESE